MAKIDFPGDIHFVTARTFKKYKFFQDDDCCKLLLQNLDFYRNKFDLKIYGYCIMPDHVHLLIYFDLDKYPELTISKIVQNIKSSTARQIIDYFKSPQYTGSQEPLLLARLDSCMEQGLHATREGQIGHKRGLKYRIWQPGFYDFNVYTVKKFDEKLEYINMNPVRAGLVDDISQYKYCSWINYENEDHSVFQINYIEY